MHQFQTRHSELDGFSEFFEREIRPTLTERDAVRQRAVRNGFVGGGIVALILAAIGTYLLVNTEESGVGFLFYIAALASTVVIFALMTKGIRSETKNTIVSGIVGYVGWSYTEEVKQFDLTPFRELFLLTDKVDRESFEDRLEGQAHGANFHSVEACLEKESRDSKGNKTHTTVFQGQLMQIDFPTKTFGRTIVLRDKGWFNPKKRSNMKRIGLADPVFEKMFEAYGTDQVEGRVILDPAFMQRMVDLETSIDGSNIRFGFDQDKLFIAVETPDQFEAGSMLKALDRPERTQKILDEIGAVFDVVDGLLAPAKRP